MDGWLYISVNGIAVRQNEFIIAVMSISPFTFMIAAWFSVSSGHKTNNGFVIHGEVSGFADSTLLFLNTATGSGKNLDSAFIIKGKFQFTGIIKEPAEKVLIKTKNLSDYKFLWLENSVVTFKAEKGNFRNAVITGSKTQEEENKLSEKILHIRQEQQQVETLLAKDSGALNKADLKKQMDQLVQKEKQAYIEYIRTHPASIISVNLLSIYGTTWGREDTRNLYNQLKPDIKKTSYGKDIAEYIALNKDITVGGSFVDFSQRDTSGNMVKLSDFKGKIVLLEFWAAWCAPCRKENPELVKTYKEYREKGFEILGVSLDDQEQAWKKAIQTDGLIWPNVCDLQGDKNKAALIYGISAVPDNFLINREGVVIARNLRGEQLKNKLKELLP